MRGLISAVRIEPPIREAVHAFKYKQIHDLKIELGAVLGYGVKKHPYLPDLIINIPIHSQRLGKRGYNQSSLLAHELSKNIDVPHEDVLIKKIKTSQQVGLSRSNRLLNLDGAFGLKEKSDVSGKKILLVDDVATTLTTLNECAKVLKTAGAKEVWGAVLYKD